MFQFVGEPFFTTLSESSFHFALPPISDTWKQRKSAGIKLLPVVPEVYIIVAGSLGLGGTGWEIVAPSFRKSSH